MKNNEKNKVQVLSFNFFVLCSIVTVWSHLHLLCVDSKNQHCSFVENTHILGVFCLIFFLLGSQVRVVTLEMIIPLLKELVMYTVDNTRCSYLGDRHLAMIEV